MNEEIIKQKDKEICICGHSKYSHEEYGFVGACLDCFPARKCKKFILAKGKEELNKMEQETIIKQKDNLMNDILLKTYNNIKGLELNELKEIGIALKNKQEIENTTNERR